MNGMAFYNLKWVHRSSGAAQVFAARGMDGHDD
jgi:hypothetical protein